MRMRSLFFKVFAILWLAQSLIFVISTAGIVHRRFPSPNTLPDALDSNLLFLGTQAMRDYDKGGCPAFQSRSRHEPSGAWLVRSDGSQVCATAAAPRWPAVSFRAPTRIEGRELGGLYAWLVPVRSSAGQPYVYAWLQPPSQRKVAEPVLLRYAFPQLPVGIAVSGLATFLLIFLFSRPIVRLRRAARALAAGDLAARVPENGAAGPRLDELKGLAHDFNHMASRMESLVAAQRLLLRDVSHELRSPLSRLSVALELAREDAGAHLDGHLDRIEREGGKLNQLVGELLTLSSIESLQDTASFTEVSLNALCRELLPDAAFEAQQRPCTVVLEEAAQCVVQGNRRLLHRALENVVRNAIRYTAAATVVTVRVCLVAGRPAIEVLDHGPGIPEAARELIFRPFYRLDDARSSGTGGFGVGLAITERLMRLHGGRVVATDTPGGGARMILAF